MSEHPKLDATLEAVTGQMSGVNVEKGIEATKAPGSECDAAVKVQKVYRSYRTRRELADSIVVTEDLWWQTIYHAKLDHSTTSFFDSPKRESAASRWYRVGSHASKVGKGLSKNDSALKLFFQHWIEAIDPRHRYGINLYVYHEEWTRVNSSQPFFYWLDIGDGRDVDLEACPRSKLQKQSVKYLAPRDREAYEYVIKEGKFIHKQTGNLMDTNKGIWIFVMSPSKKLYSAAKIKGNFHHSSFLAGGVTIAAGTIVVDEGILRSIYPHSGHYRPLGDHFDAFLSFLVDGGVNLDTVDIGKIHEDGLRGSGSVRVADNIPINVQPPNLEIPVAKRDLFSGPNANSMGHYLVTSKTHF